MDIKIKKLISVLVLMIFSASLLTPIFAEEGIISRVGAVKKDAVIGAKKATNISGVKKEEAPGQFVSECMQELLKKQPNLLKSEAQAKCRYRKLITQSVANRLSEIKEANATRFIEIYRGKISESIEKCREKADEASKAKCIGSFQARLGQVEKITEKVREKLQRIEERKLGEIKELSSINQKEAFLRYNKEIGFKARAIDKIRLGKARNNFLKAKENFLKAKQKYENVKLRFQEKKRLIKECKEDTEECKKIKEDIKTYAKEHLLNIADMVLNHLDKIKTKIESNEDLSDEEAKEMLAELEEKINQAKEVRSTIEKAETKEELIEAAKALKELWVKLKQRIKIHAGRVVNARIGGIIVKSKHLEIKLERVLERMTEKGQDISSIEPLINDFNSKLKEARENYEIAVEKFKEAKSSTINTDLIKEAQSYMKKSHEALQEAQQILKKIVLAIKQSGGEDEIRSAEVEDVEEKVEETEEATSEGVSKND